MRFFLPDSPASHTAHQLRAARYVMTAGVVAALHVGKLPPALPGLKDALGIFLLQAGFLLSLVQLAGIYVQAGLPAQLTAWLTAGAAAVNVIGNLSAGRFLARGAKPFALLMARFVSMAAGAMLAFGVTGQPALQYAGIVFFRWSAG